MSGIRCWVVGIAFRRSPQGNDSCKGIRIGLVSWKERRKVLFVNTVSDWLSEYQCKKS